MLGTKLTVTGKVWAEATWAYTGDKEESGAADPMDVCLYPPSLTSLVHTGQLPTARTCIDLPDSFLCTPLEYILLPTKQAKCAKELIPSWSSLFYVIWPERDQAL